MVAAHDHLANHASQPHALAVFGAVDAGHAVGLKLSYFAGHNYATAAAKHLDVRATSLAQQINHVFEVLDMAALVGADGDALDVFLQRGAHHLLHTAVVP